MKRKNIFERDIQVPDIVLKKADAAFATIRKEEPAAISTQDTNMTEKTRKRIFKSGWALAACITLVALSGATVFAAIHHFWSGGMQDMLTAEETQIQELEENGMALFADSSQSVTADGITITPLEIVSDGNIAFLTFAVSGTEAFVNSEEEILFDSWQLDLNPEGWIDSASGSFFDGSVTDEDGNPIKEYKLIINKTGEEGPLLGKMLHLELSGLSCVAGKAELAEPFADGPWTFDIQLPSEIHKTTYEIHQELSGSVYSVDSVDITPISMHISYSVNGKPEIWREDNNIPIAVSVTLSDGTILENGESTKPVIDSLSRGFYEAEDGSAKAYGLINLSRVIDPEEVVSITLREFSEAIAWGDVPDEIVAQEYGDEIPFERVSPGEEQYWEVKIQ